MPIQCTNCGKFIPYAGNVCPYCNADKAQDKADHDRSVSYFGAVFFGGVIATIIAISGKWSGTDMCGIVLLGPVIGWVICYAYLTQKKDSA